MKQESLNSIKLKSANVDQMQVFVIINRNEMKVNANLNVRNSLTKEYVIKDLIGIIEIGNVNMINHVILENIQIVKTVGVEKGSLINQLKNVLKILMKRNSIQIKLFIIQL